MAPAEKRHEVEKNKLSWVIYQQSEPSNLSLAAHRRQQMFLRCFHQKRCNLFAHHKLDYRAMSGFKMEAFTSKTAFESFPFVLRCFSVVWRRGWAHQLFAERTWAPWRRCLRREKQMKQSKLIETKSTPCCRELPFSELRRLLTVITELQSTSLSG